MAAEIIAVMDLQFGSTGKGLIAGTLAHKWEPDSIVTAWGPNAGHTFRMGDRTWVHRMLANGSIAPSVKNILIGPGSIVDLVRLKEEIVLARDLLRGKNLVIHPQAAMLQAKHVEAEKALFKIGSTMKGTSEAVMDKMRRDISLWATAGVSSLDIFGTLGPAVKIAGLSLAISSEHYDETVDSADRLLIEGAQGYSLGIHTDFYPHTTSRDISTAQLLADCRIPFPAPRTRFRVVGVCRTYPIRVACRRDEATGAVYTSGGGYPDQEEMTWQELGREPELTTVTKLPRRVFSFSARQIAEAARICRPDAVALTFCDYLQDVSAVKHRIKQIDSVLEGSARVRFVSFGPKMDDVSHWDVTEEKMSVIQPGSIRV